MGCTQGKSVLSEEDIDFIARNTAMNRAAVEEQYKSFLLKHPDGRISRKSFHSMMKVCT
jgi:Ca2+-binding EF-hand superfamily protein